MWAELGFVLDISDVGWIGRKRFFVGWILQPVTDHD